MSLNIVLSNPVVLPQTDCRERKFPVLLIVFMLARFDIHSVLILILKNCSFCYVVKMPILSNCI